MIHGTLAANEGENVNPVAYGMGNLAFIEEQVEQRLTLSFRLLVR